MHEFIFKTSATVPVLVRFHKRIKVFTCIGILLLILPIKGGTMEDRINSTNYNDQVCMSNLKRIYKLIKLYEHHSGGQLGFPENFQVLSPMIEDKSIFVCPNDKTPEISEGLRTSYEVVKDVSQKKMKGISTSAIAIVYEKKKNHNNGRYVLFYDGSVQLFDDKDFENLKLNNFIRAKM